MFRARSLVLLVSVVGAAACGTSPTAPSLEPLAAPALREAGSASAASTTGEFRTTPTADAAGFVRVTEGTSVKLNGSHFTGAPEGSVLRAEWGDGQRDRVPCGTCKLEHDYAPGTYTLVATFGNGADDVTKTFKVEVAPKPEKNSCSIVHKYEGTNGMWVVYGPANLAIKAGDQITASISGPVQPVDTRIHVNGVYRYASTELSAVDLQDGTVDFTIVAAADGIGGADFGGWGFLPFDWSLKVERCEAAASAVVIPAAPPASTHTPLW